MANQNEVSVWACAFVKMDKTKSNTNTTLVLIGFFKDFVRGIIYRVEDRGRKSEKQIKCEIFFYIKNNT